MSDDLHQRMAEAAARKVGFDMAADGAKLKRWARIIEAMVKEMGRYEALGAGSTGRSGFARPNPELSAEGDVIGPRREINSRGRSHGSSSKESQAR